MMSAADMPSSIALLIGLSRARQALQRARQLPGAPLLAIGRPASGVGGARGLDGELPWQTGHMPVFGADRGGGEPATASPAATGPLSPWPEIVQSRRDPAATPAPPAALTTIIAPELPRALPHRSEAATPPDPGSVERPPAAAADPAPPSGHPRPDAHPCTCVVVRRV